MGAKGNKLKGSSKRKQDQRSSEGIEVNKSVGRSQSKIKGQERQGQYQRDVKTALRQERVKFCNKRRCLG